MFVFRMETAQGSGIFFGSSAAMEGCRSMPGPLSDPGFDREIKEELRESNYDSRWRFAFKNIDNARSWCKDDCINYPDLWAEIRLSIYFAPEYHEGAEQAVFDKAQAKLIRQFPAKEVLI